MQAARIAALILVSSGCASYARLLSKTNTVNNACAAEDLKHRSQFQNKLAGVCVDMCKEVGAYPKCTCPDFVAPDSTPGVTLTFHGVARVIAAKCSSKSQYENESL